MYILPPSRGRILLGLGIAYLLAQYIYVSHYNGPRRFESMITTTTQEFPSSSNTVLPLMHLNISSILTMVSNEIKNTSNQ